MGINLSVVRIAPEPFSTAWLHPPEWDSDRLAGDREFADAFGRGFAIESIWRAASEMGYERPLDFPAARAWVRDHIPWAGNAARLLDMLDRMEHERDLWFYVSV